MTEPEVPHMVAVSPRVVAQLREVLATRFEGTDGSATLVVHVVLAEYLWCVMNARRRLGDAFPREPGVPVNVAGDEALAVVLALAGLIEESVGTAAFRAGEGT